jgi:MoaA/NifB/PqqE/SkfB family radical SAM enzyme
MIINNNKNRDREAPDFANINLLGKCSANCFFCLGKDFGDQFEGQDCRDIHFDEWPNLNKFLNRCSVLDINKVYITGLNTDPAQYKWLRSLVAHIQARDFYCGLRLNGYDAGRIMRVIDVCREEIGYSVHSLSPMTNKMIVGRTEIPNWKYLIQHSGNNVRASVVINRCNEHEFFELVAFLAQTGVKYIQARRISTDHRLDDLAPDMAAYERVYTKVKEAFPVVSRWYGDGETFLMYGKNVVFWRTIKTTANSINYFTDGTISEEYFIVEGWEKAHKKWID